MSMSASTSPSASSKLKSALLLLSGTVVLLALVLSAGLEKTSAAVKTKSAASLLAWVMLNPAALPLVLALLFALAMPCQSYGARLTAVEVCSMVLRTVPGPVLTCD